MSALALSVGLGDIPALVKELSLIAKTQQDIQQTARLLYFTFAIVVVIFVILCYGTAKTRFADIAKNFAEPSAKLHQRRGHIGCSPQQRRRCKTTPETLLHAPLDCFTLAQRAAGALSFE